MRKFTFDKSKPKLLTIQIDDKTYSFNPYTLAVKTATDKFLKTQKPLLERTKDKKLTKKEMDDIVIKGCLLVKDTINAILGKGAYEKIFKDRTVNFEEHQRLMTYIFEEITAFSKEDEPAA